MDKFIKNKEIVFPAETSLIIQELMKKYKLYREPKEIMEQMAKEINKAETLLEKKKVGEGQPERRLAKVIKEAARGKISSEDLPRQLQAIFNISSVTAKAFARDLEKNVVDLAGEVFIEEAVPRVEKQATKPLPVAPPPKEIPDISPITKSKIFPDEEEKIKIDAEENKNKEPDVYREPTE